MKIWKNIALIPTKPPPSADVAFNEPAWNEKKNKLCEYFKDRFTGRIHMSYAVHYIMCKVLSILAIVSLPKTHSLLGPFSHFSAINTQVINIVMLNMVIPGFWSSYTYATGALIAGDVLVWSTYRDLTFPTLAKCMIETTGPSGSTQVRISEIRTEINKKP